MTTGVDRRRFMEVAAAGLAGIALLRPEESDTPAPPENDPILRIETARERALVPFLSWDTEGGDRVRRNLLRDSPVTLRARTAGDWRSGHDLPTRREDAGQAVRYRLTVAPGAELVWEIEASQDRLRFALASRGPRASRIEATELVFPWDPRVTPTTIIPSAWTVDRSLRLPAVVSAPDFGQMLLSCSTPDSVTGRLEGSRDHGTVDLTLSIRPDPDRAFRLEMNPVLLPPPSGLIDKGLWRLARRGWFNAWQPSAQWGEQSRPFSAPPGLLANNVISDPASMSLRFYADLALWTAEIAPGISVAALVRDTADWWLDHRTRSSGVVIGYWDYDTFLDANSGPLLAAWDYVAATQDHDWLARRIERLEFIADYWARRDVNGDGLVEATESGNAGTLHDPARGCSWWDALNSGYQDGYSNALIYRAWRCLASLEGSLGRKQPRTRYNRLADRLKAAYAKALYNPKTGWFAWWKSADGELHDYATPVVNGLAVEYGLVDPVLGRKILARLWRKIDAVRFTHLELGLPCTLDPVRREDYLLPDAIGCPKKEDGTDTFGQYMNGGITAGQVLHFLAAHYVAGQPEKADQVLRAMLARQTQGGFEDGVTNASGKGIDWSTWDGRPCGYEGYLADVYFFLQAVLLREPSFRARYYHPLAERET